MTEKNRGLIPRGASAEGRRTAAGTPQPTGEEMGSMVETGQLTHYQERRTSQLQERNGTA